MAQKLITLEEAAEQLGISKELLLQLRTEGKVSGYRDGNSWKFRSEVIEKFAEEGLPQSDAPPSDINLDDEDLGLADDDDIVIGGGEDLLTEVAKAAPASDFDLDFDEEPPSASAGSDLSLDDVDEPTVAGLDDGGSDALALDTDSIDLNTDSILLSDAELGVSISGSPSTIIGKNELDLDADLDLSPIEPSGPVSDVKLAPPSDIIPGGDDDEIGLELPSPTDEFEGLDELEIDLEAESSRIMSPKDVAKVKDAMAAKEVSELSDIDLAPSDSTLGLAGSDVAVGSGSGSGPALPGLSALELDDDDDVLGEGSDVTLSGESSGINIISPSDSGLALDEVQLDLSGSAPLGSSLDLGGSGIDEITVDPAGISALGLGSQIGGGDFQLTPLAEGADDDEERDSSQVIALDELSEEAGPSPLGFEAEAGMLGDDFAMGGLGAGAAPVGVVSTVDTPFSVWNISALSLCLVMLGLSGMIVYDLLRNMWSWDGVTPLNSSLLESFLNPFL